MRRPDPTIPTLAVVLTAGFGVLVVVAFVASVALGRDHSPKPGDRVAVVAADGPIGFTVLAGRCADERVRAVEVRTPAGESLWRITSARGAIDRRFVVGQDPPPFAFTAVTKLRPIPAGPLEAEVTVDDVVDSEVFDPAHLGKASALRAACGNDGFGAVSLTFAIGALGVVVAYGVLVRRYLAGRR